MRDRSPVSRVLGHVPHAFAEGTWCRQARLGLRRGHGGANTLLNMQENHKSHKTGVTERDVKSLAGSGCSAEEINSHETKTGTRPALHGVLPMQPHKDCFVSLFGP